MSPLADDELRLIDAYWRAANYLSVGQIYLLDNPLLREPLRLEHIKPRLLGHWGTTPGLNLIYAHMNRAIRARDLDAIYVAGPGHGGPGLVANTYLEGTYSEVYPDISTDAEGMRRLFRQFSFPGGIPSHVAPGDARLDPRGRRARLRARARLRRGLRQPRPRRLRGRRRRRGGDRAARGQLALDLVPEPGDGRRGAADPAAQRLQDRQPHGPRPHPRGGPHQPPARLRARAALRRGRRPRRGAPGDGRGAGRLPRRDRRHPGARPRRRARRPPALADDRPADAEGVDGARRSSTACRSRARSTRTRCRWPGSRTTRST